MYVYKVVKESNLEKLEESVNSYLAQDFYCSGDLKIISTMEDKYRLYIQVMEKNIDEGLA